MNKNLEKLAGPAYYLTTDLANGDRAQVMAIAHRLRVEVLFPKDMPLRLDAVALIVDLDNLCLDAHGRRRWLAELAATPPRVMTCLHSYDFHEDSDSKNIMLARRFDSVLLRRLAAALSTVVADADSVSAEPPFKGIDDEELARIQLGSDGCPLAD